MSAATPDVAARRGALTSAGVRTLPWGPLTLLGGALIGAVMAGQAGWAAGASPWLEAMAADKPADGHFALARFVQGTGPAGMLAVLWLCRLAAAAQGALCLSLAGRGGPIGLVLATTWLLWWPDAALGLGQLGPEPLLGGGVSLVLLAGVWLERRPAVAAVAAGAGCALAALAHPLGVVLGLTALLAVGFLPRPTTRPANAATASTRDVVLPFAAALLVLASMIRLSAPPDGLKAWVYEAFELLRAPRPLADAGRGTTWPWVGALAAWASCLPAGALLGVVVATLSAIRSAGRSPASAAIATVASAGVLLAGLGLPTPGDVWLPAALAPLCVGVGAGAIGSLGSLALARAAPGTGRRGGAALVGVLLTGAALACATQPEAEPRAGWARAIGWANDVAAARPARVDQAALTLLRATEHERICLQPGQPGGVRLLERLGKLRWTPEQIRAADAFGAQALVLPRGGPSAIANAWRQCGHVDACAGPWCLVVPAACALHNGQAAVRAAR